VYRIVRANLGQVLGPDVGETYLARTTRQVFYTTLRSTYDLFRALHLPEEKLVTVVDVPDATRAVARSFREHGRGAVVVFPHLSNFDLGGHALVPFLPELQLFTLPDPPPGFQWLNETRGRTGVNVTPLSATALRQAIRLLRRGGIVGVAGDRPVSDLDEPVLFFDRPARVPSGHVRMALRADAVVSLGYCVLSPDTQRYTMHLEPPMELIRTGNRARDVQVNLRKILDALQEIILRWPDQWQMFVPVWPELLEI
jgi:KDO2-lipid IV(A) lauroyltransferase